MNEFKAFLEEYSSDVEIISGKFDSHAAEAKIFYRVFKPKSSEGIPINLFLNHGAVEYHERHLPFFQRFFDDSQFNACLVLYDLYGHGHSGGSRAYIENFSTYCEDFIKLTETVSLHLNSGKNFFCGHSLGGLITLKTLFDFKSSLFIEPAGLIFSNPCLYPTVKLPDWLEQIMNKLDYGFEKTRIPTIYESNHITSLRQRALDFERNPLISKFMTAGLATEIIKETRRVQALPYYIDTPCLFLISQNDAIVDAKGSILFSQGIDEGLAKVFEFKKANMIFSMT
jgi:alpha-beta hydrolase superfamily lysophospholipase